MRLASFSGEVRNLVGDAGSLWRVFRHPIPDDTKGALRAAWERLPEWLRTENQFLGRQYAGCGATIGLMPRCDFACRGCYLGVDANATPALPLDEVRQQLRQIRDWLGEGGNVQLTDGEVTLRPEDELVDIARYARRIGLVPMLMTHGDSFRRRRPSLLARLMTEAGLNEMSVHIDATQRGRRGSPYRHATDESALFPLRDEFAALIRRMRRETGKPLEVAATITVSGGNIADSRPRALARLVGIICQHPRHFVVETASSLWRWLTRLGDERPLSFLRDWTRSRIRVDYLSIVAHHFMTRDELSTPLGRERVASCAFRVPIGGSMVSMCEVNALGLRDRFYRKIRENQAVTSVASAGSIMRVELAKTARFAPLEADRSSSLGRHTSEGGRG